MIGLKKLVGGAYNGTVHIYVTILNKKIEGGMFK